MNQVLRTSEVAAEAGVNIETLLRAPRIALRTASAAHGSAPVHGRDGKASAGHQTGAISGVHSR